MATAKPTKRKKLGRAKKGKARNPAGVQGKVRGKVSGKLPVVGEPDYEVAKAGLISAFQGSNALGILTCFLNGELPAIFNPYIDEKTGKMRTNLTADEYRDFTMLRLRNFKWGVDIYQKTIPKQLGYGGSPAQKLELTLSFLVKRAETSKKSPEVKQLVEDKNVEGVIEYKVKDEDDEGEDE